MNGIKIFQNAQFGNMRTAESENGEPVFCLSDICSVLDLQTAAVMRRLTDDVISNHPIIDNLGRQQIANFVNEDGLYDVILDSRKPEAKAFRKWVTSEVLPAIRKTGNYSVPVTKQDLLTPEFIIRLATELKNERAEKTVLKLENREIKAEKERIEKASELAQKQLAHQAPVMAYANKVLASKTGHTPTTIGAQIGMSAYELNRLLLLYHFIRGTQGEYSLCAQYQGRGYEVLNTVEYIHKDGSVGTKIQMIYTELGRMIINRIFLRAKEDGAVIEVKGRYFTLKTTQLN